MASDQMLIIILLLLTMGAYIWGRWRHDLVAMGALLAGVGFGLIPAAEAFSGFGHPAVITVACVLIIGYGLQTTGAVKIITRHALPSTASVTLSILSLCMLAALLSAFMNNVGALALLMPVAIRIAEKKKLPPGKVLMPLSFASILGGTMTLIGTPPNLIVAGFRADAGFGSYAMFDFLPVGAALTVGGVAFIGFIGWHLVPKRKQQEGGGFDTGMYLSEVRVDKNSKAEGKRIYEVERMLDDADAQVVGFVRYDLSVTAPNPRYVLRAGDVLVVEAEPVALAELLADLNLRLEEDVAAEEKGTAEAQQDAAPPKNVAAHGEEESNTQEEVAAQEEVVIQELVVLPSAMLAGRSATDVSLRTRYGINLLAISRTGRRSIKRLRSTQIRPGDVLLMRGEPQALSAFASYYGCLPLAERDIRVPQGKKALQAMLVISVAVLAAAFALVPVAVAFAAGVFAYIALRIVPLRALYTAIDWPVIVLLAAMLPVAGAMASTGAADLIANVLFGTIAHGDAVVALVLILAATMLMTDFMNNAATAAVMCPIALSTASQLSANPDPFLMAVAVGASCAFLTPIGHQNNTLILGPGGFRFGDYWRMGLPTDLLVIAISIPMLLWVWPL
ncbi:MAG: SLC13 family permease [Desulfuromonadaceae bacterium]|nr:SLC13 family permease [Desulfuromonadaceae bacterium]